MELEEFLLNKMFDPQFTAHMFAAKEEGQSWGAFTKLYFDDDMNWEERRQQAVNEGYKILIIPSQNVIYDKIANVVQSFDEKGRGQIIG